MSRNTPVPDVDIVANIIADSESGVNIANITIDVKVGEFSNGFVILDEPEDLFILRNAIDNFIAENNLQNPYL